MCVHEAFLDNQKETREALRQQYMSSDEDGKFITKVRLGKARSLNNKLQNSMKNTW